MRSYGLTDNQFGNLLNSIAGYNIVAESTVDTAGGTELAQGGALRPYSAANFEGFHVHLSGRICVFHIGGIGDELALEVAVPRLRECCCDLQ